MWFPFALLAVPCLVEIRAKSNSFAFSSGKFESFKYWNAKREINKNRMFNLRKSNGLHPLPSVLIRGYSALLAEI